MAKLDVVSPVDQHLERRRSLVIWVLLGAVFISLSLLFWRIVPEVPTAYADVREHFKYGSIGSEPSSGVPYWIWKVLPDMFPEYLPKDYHDARDYTSCGFLQEPGRDTPIGFSKRRVLGIDLVGLNCAVCHTGSVRTKPTDEPRIILGMPANTMDLQKYFNFLFHCAADPRFTEQNLMAHIDAVTDLSVVEQAIYCLAIPRMRNEVLIRKSRLSYLERLDDQGNRVRPTFGPGRVDTFNPYKSMQFSFPMENDSSIGTADLPSLWNQQIREGMWLHWDGNNDSVAERNKSAAMGAGATPVSLDLPRMQRVKEWCDTLPPPKFTEYFGTASINRKKAEEGGMLYRKHCAHCHDAAKDSRVGKVIPLEEIQTDRERLDSFTEELAGQMNTLGAGHEWRFHRFRKTHGYAAMPLDGVWARAPYLHNGSVPTLWDLLQPAPARPTAFFRGDNVYDADKVGFRSTVQEERGRRFFLFDTRLRGNGNHGHTYGTELSAEQKQNLVEYVKTL